MSLENSERKRKSQDRIENAFVELILAEERKNIKVSNICKLAKVNRTTFYTNYIDLCDLISKIRYSKFKLLDKLLNDKDFRTKDNLIALFEDAKNNNKFYLSWLDLFLERDCIMLSDYLKQEKNKHDSVEDYYSETGFKQGLLAIIYNYVRDDCPIEPETLVNLVFTRKFLENIKQD